MEIINFVLAFLLVLIISFGIPVGAFIITYRTSSQHPMSIRVLSSLLMSAAILLFLILFQMSWFFRDGMGPDSQTSSGLTAVKRVMENVPVFALICSPIFILGLALLLLSFIYQKRKKTAEK